MSRLGPVLVLNPQDDARFVAEAERYSKRGATRPEDLETALRKHYPGAVVGQRALSGEFGVVWYVYREGRWVPSAASSRSGMTVTRR